MALLLMLMMFLTCHVVSGQSTNNDNDQGLDQKPNDILLSTLVRQSRVLDELVKKINQQQLAIEKVSDKLTNVDEKVLISDQQLVRQSRGLEELVHKMDQQQLVIQNIHTINNTSSNKRSNVDKRVNDNISQQLTAIIRKVDSLATASFAEHRWQLGALTAGEITYCLFDECVG